MNRNAVLYARVSTDEQAESGYSLPTQLESCRRYAERLGYSVIAELREDHSGATPIADRPVGKQLVEMLKRREADAIIGYQVDRLSRDIVDLLANVRGWLRAGVEVHACDIGKIESELDIVLVIKGWQGSDERKKILERTLRGKYAKAQAGKVVGSASPPYGYGFDKILSRSRLVAFGFVIQKEEARVVRRIYTWYTEGDGDSGPLSMWGITKKLSESRIPTPGETRRVKRVRESGIWTSSMVLRILRDEAYAGVWRFGKRMGGGRRDGTRPLEEQVMVNIPPIVDRDLWEQAQARREYNKRMSRRNCKQEYLLRGLIRCGCGYSMTGRNMRRRYYTCCMRVNRLPSLEPETCKEKSVRADIIEPLVWEYVLALFSDAQQFEQSIVIAQRAEQETLAPKRDELKSIEKLIQDTETEAAEVARGFARVGGGLVGRKLEEQVKEVEARYAALTKRRDELNAKLSTYRLNDENLKAALRFREDVIAGLQDPTSENKRRILEILGVQVTIKYAQAQIQCAIPTSATIVSRTSADHQLFRGGG